MFQLPKNPFWLQLPRPATAAKKSPRDKGHILSHRFSNHQNQWRPQRRPLRAWLNLPQHSMAGKFVVLHSRGKSVYDPQSNTWTTYHTPLWTRAMTSVCAHKGRLVVFLPDGTARAQRDCANNGSWSPPLRSRHRGSGGLRVRHPRLATTLCKKSVPSILSKATSPSSRTPTHVIIIRSLGRQAQANYVAGPPYRPPSP